MPIWAIVLTQAVALYGAVLSTFIFLGARPKLRFNARVDRGMFVQIDVANYGGRPTTLTKIVIHHFENPRSWARLGNRAIRTSLIVDPTLPFELQPGGVWSGRTLMDRRTREALCFDLYLYHSHSAKPMRRRVRFRSAPPDP
jgi:hypothetical protein